MTWWSIGIAAIVVVLVVVLLVYRPWRRRSAPQVTPDGVVADRANGGRLIRVAIVIGWVFIVWVIVVTWFDVAGTVMGNLWVPIRTEPYWPALPLPQDHIGGLSFVEGGGLTDGHAYITDLSPAARTWDIIADLVAAAALITTALVIIRLCRRLRDGKGIAGTARAFSTLAIVSLVAGLIWQIADQFGGYLAAQQVSPPGAGTSGDELWSHWPVPANTLFSLNFWPVLPFLAFGALAAAFRYAERLQRDTEGLV